MRIPWQRERKPAEMRAPRFVDVAGDLPRPNVPKTAADYEAEDAAIKAIAVELREQWGPLPALPAHEEHPICPKCGSLAVTVEYHGVGGHAECVDSDYHRQGWLRYDDSPKIKAASLVRAERAVEHMDRKCVNCGFGWATDIVRAEVVAPMVIPTTEDITPDESRGERLMVGDEILPKGTVGRRPR